jgi:hypothetical protein
MRDKQQFVVAGILRYSSYYDLRVRLGCSESGIQVKGLLRAQDAFKFGPAFRCSGHQVRANRGGRIYNCEGIELLPKARTTIWPSHELPWLRQDTFSSGSLAVSWGPE